MKNILKYFEIMEKNFCFQKEQTTTLQIAFSKELDLWTAGCYAWDTGQLVKDCTVVDWENYYSVVILFQTFFYKNLLVNCSCFLYFLFFFFRFGFWHEVTDIHKSQDCKGGCHIMQTRQMFLFCFDEKDNLTNDINAVLVSM